jgi:hypothetical protein
MTLIVEDGLLPEGANAYCDVAFADEYLASRWLSGWPEPGTDEEAKERALIRAADYLNGIRWNGRKPLSPEPRMMAWPRVGAFDSDGGNVIGDSVVPRAVMAANAYLASLVLAGTEIQPSLERGGRIQQQKVGSLSVTFFPTSLERDVYSALADLISGLAPDYRSFGPGADGGGGLTTIHAVVQ